MSMDWQGLLYDPNYDVLGVEAVLTPRGLPALEPITVLDKTSGVEVVEAGSTVQTVKPAAVIRIRELEERGLTDLDLLDNSEIVLNGMIYTGISYLKRPSPKGELDGEVYLFLSGGTVVETPSEDETATETVTS